MVKGMRETAVEDFNKVVDQYQKYAEGQKEGFEKGYDRAIQDMQGILKKYHIGAEKPSITEEKELKPAIRFLKQPEKKLLDKIVEEVDEVLEAYNDGESKRRIAEEVADVQEACETYLAKLGYSAAERKQVRLQVIDKNGKRGYYMAKDGSYGD